MYHYFHNLYPKLPCHIYRTTIRRKKKKGKKVHEYGIDKLWHKSRLNRQIKWSEVSSALFTWFMCQLKLFLHKRFHASTAYFNSDGSLGPAITGMCRWNANYFTLIIMGGSLVFRQVCTYHQLLLANIHN